MRVIPVLSALLLSSLTAAAQPTTSVTLMPRQWPIARLEAPMVYDALNQRVVVFGGYDHNYNRYNEVWEYYPVSQVWRNVTPTSGPQPAPRQGSTIAYDSTRQKIVLFGGQNNALQFLGDTWLWDCNARTWTEVATGGTPGVNKPDPRYGVAMVYDPSRDRAVLHGGIDQNKFYKDTWLFDFGTGTWSALATTTSSGNGRVLLARGFHAMTITSGTSPNNRVFLFGGQGFEGNPPQLPVLPFEDLWELVGSTWTDRTPAGVAAGNNGACNPAASCPGKAGWRAFTFDPSGNRLLTQGGWNGTGNLKETRAFSLASNTWSVVTPNIGGVDNLSTRDSHAMVYAAVASKVILFGGYLSDVWELQGSTWTSPPAFDPRISTNPYTYMRQDYHAMTWDSARSQVVAVSGGSAETWRLNPVNWSWANPNVGGFTERVGHAIAYAPAPVDRVLMFGGRCKSIGAFTGGNCGAGGTLFNDLRAYNPATGAWTLLSPSGGPPPARWDHAFVYDATNARFVLYGGRDAAGSPFGDTWLLNCTGPATCAWSAGPAGPPNRYGHGMTYDAVRQRVVLFGGHSGVGPYGDTWEWNGSAWSNLTPGGASPSARVHPALSPYSSLLGGVLLFGGHDGAPRNDAWLWNGTQWQATLLGGAAPRARENGEAVFVPSVARVLLFGGFDAGGVIQGDPVLLTRMVKGDMDQNDTTDLVLRSPSTPNPVLWTMNGIDRQAELTASAALAANEQISGVDDFNFDGRNDFALWNSASGAVTFWFMNGATRLGTGALSGAATLPTDWKLAASADFTHDGKPDLLFRNALTQKLVIWAMNGTQRVGAYPPNPDQAVDANWEVVGALDYDADGNTDLLWYNPVSGKIVFWYLDYNAVRLTGIFANPANAGNNNWKVLAAGDFGTGGGPPGSKDLVWRNADSGRFVVWYMDNAANRLAGVFTNPLEPAPSPTLWTIVGPR